MYNVLIYIICNFQKAIQNSTDKIRHLQLLNTSGK